MAYEYLKRVPLFSRGQIEYQIVNNKPEPLGPQFANCGLGVMAGLAKSPENRPTTCVEIVANKSHQGRSDPQKTPVKRFGGRAISIVLVLGVIGASYGWFAWRHSGIHNGGGQLGASGSSVCALTNLLSQVELEGEMKMVRREALIDALGLKEGVDLNKIDFAARRKVVLSEIPNLRTLSITRDRSGRIIIVAEERVPFVRLGVVGSRQVTGRVADSEGVVFVWQRGVQSLPLILENEFSLTMQGCCLTGQSFAALNLIKACKDAEFTNIHLLEVDSSRGILRATLDDGSCLKISWDEMEQGGAVADQDLRNRLRMLLKVMATKVKWGNVTWHLTEADKVLVDTNDNASCRADASSESGNESAVGDVEELEKKVNDLRISCESARKEAEKVDAVAFAPNEMGVAFQLSAAAFSAEDTDRKRAYYYYANASNAFEHARQVAMEASKPKVTLKAMLNGEEVNATVISGLKDKTRKTPVVVDLSGWRIGSTCEFQLVYVCDGLRYSGSGRYFVKKGHAVLPVELSPEKKRSEGDLSRRHEYTVMSGDTLNLIAQAFGVTVDGIIQLNNLNGGVLRVGQKLQIPSAEAIDDFSKKPMRETRRLQGHELDGLIDALERATRGDQ